MLRMRATYERPGFEKGKQGIQELEPEVLKLRQELMDEMRGLHIRTHSYKNHGHLPRVTMPQLLEEV